MAPVRTARRSISSPGSPDRPLPQGQASKEKNRDGRVPAELPTVTPSVPTTPAPKKHPSAEIPGRATARSQPSRLGRVR
jgi:hypothetical protein